MEVDKDGCVEMFFAKCENTFSDDTHMTPYERRGIRGSLVNKYPFTASYNFVGGYLGSFCVWMTYQLSISQKEDGLVHPLRRCHNNALNDMPVKLKETYQVCRAVDCAYYRISEAKEK